MFDLIELKEIINKPWVFIKKYKILFTKRADKSQFIKQKK